MPVEFFDGGSGGGSGPISAYQDFHTDRYVLTVLDIANKAVVLTFTPKALLTVLFFPKGGPIQDFVDDYYLSGNQIKWDGRVLESLLEAGDIIFAFYEK